MIMARPTFLFSLTYLFSQCPSLRFANMANSLVNRDGAKNTYAVYLLFHLPLAVSSIKVTLRQFLPEGAVAALSSRFGWLSRLVMLDIQTIIALVALVISMPPTLAVLINWWRKSQRQSSSAYQDAHDGLTASISSNSSVILTVEMVAMNRFPLSESSD
ncbi:hypothetical protein N5P37_009533 [Trichoderma harzianum]|nr:hypothetical protein N5P37_009533 [Trichoderma harzianum]